MIKQLVSITYLPVSLNRRAETWPVAVVNTRKILNKEGDSFAETTSFRQTNWH